jgi:acetyl esterase/lipase
MLSSWALLFYGTATALGVLNARWPRKSLLLLGTSWVWAWLVVELAPHLIAVSAVIVAALIWLGGLHEVPGWVGLGLWVAAVGAGVRYAWGSWRTRVSVDGGARDAKLDLEGAPKVPWYFVALPLLAPWRRGVSHRRGIVYAEVDGRRLKLDIFRPTRDLGRPLPAVIHVHGGAWVFGSRREQGIPLLNHLAANGWVGVNVAYRLSPWVALPAQVQDVKRAIVWVREHADELGMDPSFIALTGGSAGGHLVALAALTSKDISLQPGFEDAGAHVDAAVPFYGIYDFLAPRGHHHPQLTRLVEWLVVKDTIRRRPELFRRLSPLHRVHADAPPFFVVHGSGDTLVPPAESRHFVRRLREVSRQPVLYAEIVGAQHAFDMLPTWRSVRVIRAIERFPAAAYATRRASPIETEHAIREVVEQ